MAWNNFPAYGGYSPAQTYMPQMPIQGTQSAPVPQGGPSPQAGFRCVPVTSQSQADTFQIPFDGSTTYFVDTSNGKIYGKSFDFSTGCAPLVVYVREQSAPAVQYATLEDLNALREELTKPRKAGRKNEPDPDE